MKKQVDAKVTKQRSLFLIRHHAAIAVEITAAWLQTTDRRFTSAIAIIGMQTDSCDLLLVVGHILRRIGVFSAAKGPARKIFRI